MKIKSMPEGLKRIVVFNWIVIIMAFLVVLIYFAYGISTKILNLVWAGCLVAAMGLFLVMLTRALKFQKKWVRFLGIVATIMIIASSPFVFYVFVWFFGSLGLLLYYASLAVIFIGGIMAIAYMGFNREVILFFRNTEEFIFNDARLIKYET